LRQELQPGGAQLGYVGGWWWWWGGQYHLSLMLLKGSVSFTRATWSAITWSAVGHRGAAAGARHTQLIHKLCEWVDKGGGCKGEGGRSHSSLGVFGGLWLLWGLWVLWHVLLQG
jgi:hypothetical protein